MLFRPATASDVDAVTNTIALAFATDPLWGPALARADGSTDHAWGYWRLFVEGALPHGTVFMLEHALSVAVWIPPGESEMSDDAEASLRQIVTDNLNPDGAAAMFELWDRFDGNHPTARPPHAYLSLLATHPDNPGKGLGQQLLADTLDHFAGLPAYLESTNPVNNHRYERQGFAPIGGFQAVLNDAPVTTMWRDAS
jgi:GNAT superfamily N-acetyltransferase